MRSSVILIAASMLAAFCAAGPTAPGDAQRDGVAWSIDLSTSGGFAGTGRGAIHLSSDGGVDIERIRASRCRTTASLDERTALAAAIDRSAPAGWRDAALDVAAPDAFKYELTLTTKGGRRDGAYTAIWWDNTHPRLPADLAGLVERVDALWSRAMKSCGA